MDETDLPQVSRYLVPYSIHCELVHVLVYLAGCLVVVVVVVVVVVDRQTDSQKNKQTDFSVCFQTS